MDNKLNSDNFIDMEMDENEPQRKRKKKNLKEIETFSSLKKEKKEDSSKPQWFSSFNLKQIYQKFKITGTDKSLHKKKSDKPERKKSFTLEKNKFENINEVDFENTNFFLTNDQWLKILSHSNNKMLFDQNIFAIKNQMIKEGSPSQRREIIWHYLASVTNLKSKYVKFKYSEKSNFVNSNQIKQIEKDLSRTTLPVFNDDEEKKIYINKLRNILVAYSNLNLKVGYVQGMNVIVSHLLYNICHNNYKQLKYYEELIFWLFASLMENYKIKNIYSEKMEGIFVLTSNLENCVKLDDEKFYEFLDTKNV